MAGIRHVRHLADIEALQNRKNILRPGRNSFGGGFGRSFGAGVHFHFRSGGRDCISGRDSRWSHTFRKSKSSISVCIKEYGSMNANARELAASFDIEKLTPEFYADPYPTYRALREHEPVKLLANGSYFLTRYDDLVSAYKNTRVFSSDKKTEFAPKYGDSPLYEHHTTSLVFNDPPAHARVRRLIMGALSPRPTASMEGDRSAVAGGRAKPGNPERDVLTRLIQGEDNGERLSEKELLHNCIFLLNAGHETTTNLIGNGLVALSAHQAQKKRLIEHPDLIKTAVEEI